MSNTVKVVIEISKEIYQDVVKYGFIYEEDNEDISRAIRKGTSLDSVMAKIADIETYERDGCWVMADVWKVLNDIGKEREDKLND